MDTKEKLGAFNQLLSDKYHEADYELLKKKDPRHDVFRNPAPSSVQYREALYVLLDIVGVDEIKKNRQGWLKKKAAAEVRRKAKLKRTAEKKAADQKAEREKEEKDAAGQGSEKEPERKEADKGEKSFGEPVKKNPVKGSSKKSKSTQKSSGTA